MKVSNIQLQIEDNSILLTADCTIRSFGSDKVYFKFDRKFENFIFADAGPFAASLLIPSMKLGEDLVVDGELSEKQYSDMQCIMEIMLTWDIGLKPISIIAHTIKKDTHSPTESASFFSGGVDSFYTYLKNKNSDKEKIKYFILANGYDISLDNQKLWEMACGTVKAIAREEQVEVITVESNIRDLIEPIIPWDYTHGGCLTALGLALRKKINTVFIASSYAYTQLFPWGSHPTTDHFWNTETIQFHHDGANVNRFEKVRYISNYPVVQDNLRVCYRNKKDKYNCGTCDKCIRTMIALHISGTLNQSKTFPHNIDPALIRHMKIDGEHGAMFQEENFAELRARNTDPELQDALQEALMHTKITTQSGLGLLRKIWYLDHMYNRSRMYRLLRKLRKFW
jgi:hypothetical protein